LKDFFEKFKNQFNWKFHTASLKQSFNEISFSFVKYKINTT
jgi:hypothetical protein